MSNFHWIKIVLVYWIVINTGASPVFEDRTANWTMDRTEPDLLSKVGRAARAFPSVVNVYPEIGSDLTKVTWAHGVDSKKKLRHALRGNVMMIEADVSMGKLKNDPSSGKRPIMAHPPVKTSDLTLEDFLDTIIDSDIPRGIKLDIKSTSVYEQTLEIIKAREAKIHVPLWLNADILQGPVGSTADPIDPTMFLLLSKLYFPTAVISSGWTTRFGPNLAEQLTVVKDGSYTFDQVRQMRDTLAVAQIVQPVTFPIRAGLSTSVESRENILWLLNQIPGSTVTIWGAFGDEVNVPGLLDLIDAIGKDRVMYIAACVARSPVTECSERLLFGFSARLRSGELEDYQSVPVSSRF